MELKKRSWRDVSISEYDELVDRLTDESLSPQDIQVIKVAFITGLDEDDVWDLKLDEFNRAISSASWMDSFDIDQRVKFSKINLADEQYTIDTNLQHFTVAQYVDFQTFWPQLKAKRRVLPNLIACFLLPKGKAYGEGYDVQQLVATIANELDIMTANEIMFFFLKQYLISTRATANYFNWMMKRLKKRCKDKEKMEQLEQSWDQMKRAVLDGFRLSTGSVSSRESLGMTSSI